MSQVLPLTLSMTQSTQVHVLPCTWSHVVSRLFNVPRASRFMWLDWTLPYKQMDASISPAHANNCRGDVVNVPSEFVNCAIL